jgi:hypothetical protein
MNEKSKDATFCNFLHYSNRGGKHLIWLEETCNIVML